MKFSKYYRIVLAYRCLIILLSSSAFVTSILFTYIVPKVYEGKAVVLIRPQEKVKLALNKSDKEILDFPLSQLAPIDAPVKTYIEFIKSRPIAEKIVSTLDLSEKKHQEGSWGHFKENIFQYIDWMLQILKYGEAKEVDPFTRAVENVRKNLSLQGTKDTYVFEITYTSANPQEVSTVANTVAEIFTEYLLALSKKESMASRLAIERQLRENEHNVANARLALRQFKQKHGSFSLAEEYSSKLKVISDLEASLEKSKASLASAITMYASSHPKVLSIIAEKDKLIQSINELKKETISNPEKEKTLEDLKMREKVEEENYSSVKSLYEEARIQEAKNSSEIRIISQAIPPAYPLKPIKMFYALGGLFAGVVFAVVLAFFLEFQDIRLRSVEDVSAALQLPVLATIPLTKR
ncbi:MAG TPA: GNVR domain-containing protein [Nitrososphaera sp.]